MSKLDEIKAKGKAAEDKINEEAKRIEKKTGIPKELVIGLVIVAGLIILAKLGVI